MITMLHLLPIVIFTLWSVEVNGEITVRTIVVSKGKPIELFPFGVPMMHTHCGANKIQEYMGRRSLRMSCPNELELELNHCCAVHDDCYNQMLDREFCDHTFCDCNEEIAIKSGMDSCLKNTKTRCTLVGIFGGFSYGKNSTGPERIHAVPEDNIPGLVRIWQDLLHACKLQKTTYSSCAVNYNICKRNYPDGMRCEHKIHSCFIQAFDERTREQKCDKTAQKAQELIKNYIRGTKPGTSSTTVPSPSLSPNLSESSTTQANPEKTEQANEETDGNEIVEIMYERVWGSFSMYLVPIVTFFMVAFTFCFIVIIVYADI